MRDEDEVLDETLQRTLLPDVPESRPYSEVNGRRVRP